MCFPAHFNGEDCPATRAFCDRRLRHAEENVTRSLYRPARHGRIPRRIRAQQSGPERYNRAERVSKDGGVRAEMATDYDSPRKTDDDVTEDSLQELQARRMDKSSTAIDIDPDDIAESLELPGADLSNE